MLEPNTVVIKIICQICESDEHEVFNNTVVQILKTCLYNRNNY